LISLKIVRDNIPNFAKNETNNKHIAFDTMNDKDFYIGLKDKLVEESKEFRDAQSNDKEIEELADVFEVIDRLVQIKGKEMGLSVNVMRKRVQKIQKDKRSFKGGFKKNIFMYSTAIVGSG
jgi:predicted house-cleaning noncanonical NTP pyrophosphatase (MazG superfamily)